MSKPGHCVALECVVVGGDTAIAAIGDAGVAIDVTDVADVHWMPSQYRRADWPVGSAYHPATAALVPGAVVAGPLHPDAVAT